MAWQFLFALLVFFLGLCCGNGEGEARRMQVDAAWRAGDPNRQVKFDFSPFLIQYRSGRVQRLGGTDVVAASVDARTGVASKDVLIDRRTGLASRVYIPSSRAGAKLPVLLYFHGGAFVIESAFSPVYHNFLNALADRAGIVAVSVNYRLAPEHPLPAAYDDSWTALRWVLANARYGPEPWLAKHGDLSRLFVAGDSAGGNIAHNLAMRAGEQGLDGGARIEGIALLDPYFQGRYPPGAGAADPAYLQSLAKVWKFVSAGRYGTNHPYVNPLALPAASWRQLGCARVLVTASEFDRLGPWQRVYVPALQWSGWRGQADLYVTQGEGHCYFLNKPWSPKALMEMATLVAFIHRS